MERHKLVIVGGGPAGYTAALYAARANLKPLCIEGYAAGGMLMTTGVVENYPGFADGVTGPELMARPPQRRPSASAPSWSPRTSRRSTCPPGRSGWTLTGSAIEAEALIVATGASAKRLGLASEEALEGYGVANCVACDGAFFKDKRVAVVGGGDSAMDQAMALAKIAREVVVIHRREAFRATRDHGRVRARPRERLVRAALHGAGDPGRRRESSHGVRLRDEQHAAPSTSSRSTASSYPSATTLRPSSSSPSSTTTTTAISPLCRARRMTSVEGVFAAGDVHDQVYRQVVTAAGSGCMAAIDAERWLGHRGGWAARRRQLPSTPSSSRG